MAEHATTLAAVSGTAVSHVEQDLQQRIEGVQRRIAAAGVELNQLSQQLEQAQWLREYESTDAAKPSMRQ